MRHASSAGCGAAAQPAGEVVRARQAG
jgi:hypothetical protein